MSGESTSTIETVPGIFVTPVKKTDNVTIHSEKTD